MAKSKIGELYYSITGDSKELDKSLKGSQNQAAKFAKFLKSALGIGGAIVVLNKLINVGKELVKAYGVQEQAEEKLRSAIRATGKEGLISAESLFEYASELQRVTTYGDEATISAMALLQQLSDLDEKGIRQLMPLIQDMAQAMGMDLEMAASLVGKTLGSTTNALSRYGIQIDATALKESKVEQLTTALRGKFGGLAQDLATTGTGALQQYQNALGDLKEAGGKALLDFLKPGIEALTELITKTKNAISESQRFKEMAQRVAEGEASAADEASLLAKKIEETEAAYAALGSSAGAYGAYAEQAKKGLAEQIRTMKARLGMLQEVARWEAVGAAEKRRMDAEELAREEEKAQKAKDMAEWIEMVNTKYDETEEAQRAILAAEIAKWEYEFSRSPNHRLQIQMILDMLYEQRDANMEVAASADGLRQSVGLLSEQEHTAGENAVQLYQARVQAAQEEAEARIAAEEEAAQRIESLRQGTFDFISGILSAQSSIQQAELNAQLSELDRWYEQQLELVGDNEEEKERIREEYEAKRAKLEYEAALKAWKLELLGGVAAGARAILEAAKNTWPIPAIPLMGFAGVLTGAQIAAIRKNKPIPEFSTGADFIVPQGYPNDTFPMLAESGEHVQITSKDEVSKAETVIHNVVNLDGKKILEYINHASNYGEVRLNSRAIMK